MSVYYPKVFRYSDKNSIKGNADTDLKLSFEKKCIARNRSVAIGDEVLVVSRRDGSEELSFFVCEVIDSVGETNLWADKGGKTWKFGYEIQPLSKIVTMHKVVIEAVINAKFHWKTFSGLSFSNYYIMKKNNAALRKLIDYCIKNHST